jgi:hypothetical protein
MNWDFLSQPPFYYLLFIGMAAMIPRARYIADRFEAQSQSPDAPPLKPNLAQRITLFLPGICALYGVFLLQSMMAGVLLVVAYLIMFAGLIIWFRGPVQVKPSSKK